MSIAENLTSIQQISSIRHHDITTSAASSKAHCRSSSVNKLLITTYPSSKKRFSYSSLSWPGFFSRRGKSLTGCVVKTSGYVSPVKPGHLFLSVVILYMLKRQFTVTFTSLSESLAEILEILYTRCICLSMILHGLYNYLTICRAV